MRNTYFAILTWFALFGVLNAEESNVEIWTLKHDVVLISTEEISGSFNTSEELLGATIYQLAKKLGDVSLSETEMATIQPSKPQSIGRFLGEMKRYAIYNKKSKSWICIFVESSGDRALRVAQMDSVFGTILTIKGSSSTTFFKGLVEKIERLEGNEAKNSKIHNAP